MNVPDWSSFEDGQLLSIDDAFDVKSMEIGLSEDELLLAWDLLEEIARRDLRSPDDRASEAGWIVEQMFPAAPQRKIEIPPTTPLPGVTVNVVTGAGERRTFRWGDDRSS